MEKDPLIVGASALELVDLCLVTVVPSGLYLCGYVDKKLARATKDMIHSKSTPEYNAYEYSMRPCSKVNVMILLKYSLILTHIWGTAGNKKY